MYKQNRTQTQEKKERIKKQVENSPGKKWINYGIDETKFIDSPTFGVCAWKMRKNNGFFQNNFKEEELFDSDDDYIVEENPQEIPWFHFSQEQEEHLDHVHEKYSK